MESLSQFRKAVIVFCLIVFALSTLGAAIMLVPVPHSLAQDHGGNQTRQEVIVTIGVDNIKLVTEFSGEIRIEVIDERGSVQCDSAELNMRAGEVIVHESEFAVASPEFEWAVQLQDGGGSLMLVIRGRANAQGEAWYTAVSFPGRSSLALATESAEDGIVTIESAVTEAILHFGSEWKDCDGETFLVTFALDGDADGEFETGEVSKVSATVEGGYLQAESNALVSATWIADFKISVSDASGDVVVDMAGQCDFEYNQWTARSWFDRAKIMSITAKSIYKVTQLVTSLPNLVSMAEKSEGSEEPGWQEGAEMTFREPTSSSSWESYASLSTGGGNSTGGETDIARDSETSVIEHILEFIEENWVAAAAVIVAALGIVTVGFLKARSM